MATVEARKTHHVTCEWVNSGGKTAVYYRSLRCDYCLQEWTEMSTNREVWYVKDPHAKRDFDDKGLPNELPRFPLGGEGCACLCAPPREMFESEADWKAACEYMDERIEEALTGEARDRFFRNAIEVYRSRQANKANK